MLRAVAVSPDHFAEFVHLVGGRVGSQLLAVPVDVAVGVGPDYVAGVVEQRELPEAMTDALRVRAGRRLGVPVSFLQAVLALGQAAHQPG